jgi:ABC-type uncharacterized transport system permease subunit
MSILLNVLAAAAYAGVAVVHRPNLPGRAVAAVPVEGASDRSIAIVAGIRLAAASAAWVLHALALAASLTGDFVDGQPRFGWTLALSITGWLLVAIYGLESGFFKRLQVPAVVWWAAAASCLLVWIAPPARPVASSANVWFTGHWVFGLAAYALLAAAVLHGVWLLRADAALRRERGPRREAAHQAPWLQVPLLTLEKLMLRLSWAGFAMLSLSLLLGIVFGQAQFGHALRADHKTVFSILAWLVIGQLLFANQFLGLRGRSAVRWLIAGAVLLLLGYVGSRFVLDVVLGRPAAG